jgi:hypothetical protein
MPSAGDPDVGFLAVGPGDLVDAADRARGAAEQLRAAQQNPLQQRAERELARQVLGHGDQPGRPGGGVGRQRGEVVATPAGDDPAVGRHCAPPHLRQRCRRRAARAAVSSEHRPARAATSRRGKIIYSKGLSFPSL